MTAILLLAPACVRKGQPGALVLLGALGLLLGGSKTAPAYECLVEPNRTVEIRTPVEGIISNITVSRGDPVKAGEVLVELDSTVERASLEVAKFRSEMTGPTLAAKNRLLYARKKMERFNNLQGQSFVSAQQRDEAEAEERLAEAELTDAVEQKELARIEYRRTKALLEQRSLRSPFAGFVAERNLNPGDLADPNASSKAILKLSELDPLKVAVTLPMELIGQITVDSAMQIKTEGGRLITDVVVASVDAQIDAKSGTFQVHLRLPNPGNAIPAGTSCDASIADRSIVQ